MLLLKSGFYMVEYRLVLRIVPGNIGGGGFMVARLQNGKNITMDYREKAPAAAGRDMYLDAAGNPQMNLSQFGHLASGVPGTVQVYLLHLNMQNFLLKY